ncbi:hypothetical protein K458DRAFT_514 [Lentithecium fluviatile CBS 122367]|uniref:Uncharacterized protein n=1 Tax=Lentithecium fluviatile CBS 122367 TaxID=1168545 RepID=A0A6G1JMH1_9PLEO|nr:hypothetical protein K458DRAFT_514 [Lentithecium fluviatile CBS 122367]
MLLRLLPSLLQRCRKSQIGSARSAHLTSSPRAVGNDRGIACGYRGLWFTHDVTPSFASSGPFAPSPLTEPYSPCLSELRRTGRVLSQGSFSPRFDSPSCICKMIYSKSLMEQHFPEPRRLPMPLIIVGAAREGRPGWCRIAVGLSVAQTPRWLPTRPILGWHKSPHPTFLLREKWPVGLLSPLVGRLPSVCTRIPSRQLPVPLNTNAKTTTPCMARTTYNTAWQIFILSPSAK